jgi:hypothetical protein
VGTAGQPKLIFCFMRSLILLFLISIISSSCQKDNTLNQNYNFEKKLELRKRNWKGLAADVGGGLSGVSTGAWYGSFLGPEGTVIGGMLGGVMGCVGASVGAGRIIPNENEFTLVNLPLIPSIENNIYVIQNTNFDLDHISSIHNKLLFKSLELPVGVSDDDTYDFIFLNSVEELKRLGVNFENFNLAAFKNSFKSTFLSLLNDSNNSKSTRYEIVMDGFFQNNSSDEEFEAHNNSSFSNSDINDLEFNFGLAVLHGTYYFWK